jgi:DSF synthase
MGAEQRISLPFLDTYRYLSFRHDPEQGIVWFFMQPEPRPCFSLELLTEIRQFQCQLREAYESGALPEEQLRYLVLASRCPGVFNLGGDLGLFLELIRRQDRDALRRYAKACIDVLHPNAVSLDLPITTVSLVQGSALGGGLEAALSGSVIVAERSASLGLPEILFNLFPGMGAYSFLARRLNAAQAERFILSGRTYSASELHEMGLVDVVADDGGGEEAVYTYVRKQNRCRNGATAVHALRHLVNPVTYQELMDIAMLWVDRAFKLSARDLRVMERLWKAQTQVGRTQTSAQEQVRRVPEPVPRASVEGAWQGGEALVSLS